MNDTSLSALLENGPKTYDEVASTLIRIADNILKNGSDEKYRSVRIDSKAFQEKLLPFDGAVQCLMEMGFEEDDGRFSFPDCGNIDNLKAIRDELEKHRNQRVTSPSVVRSQKEVLSRVKSHFQHSRMYENTTLQNKAKSVIPMAQLRSQAQRRLKKPSSSNSAPSLPYCLLLELLAWFKKSFFTWTNAPKCTNCQTTQKAQSIGMLPPSQEDRAWGASNVEGYRCPACTTTLRFPRYNHPEKLLQTRTGRCGEWANCFTLVCRAMGFEARHVLDWTDHVWTEVFIPEWNRWIHCDPCENTCDKPLMYEQGWKKKLSLIVAASAEEVVDVTWRYSVDRQGVGERRNVMFEERWLEATLKNLNNTLSIAVVPQRKRELERRRQEELKELQQMKDVGGEEYEGRTSGSLEWRLARGETRCGTTERQSKMTEVAPIELTNVEIRNGFFHVEYSSSSDEYTRISNENETLYGWDAMTCRSRDVMRKEELDWNKAYLCRREGTKEGYISWKVIIPQSQCIRELQVRVESATFETGIVKCLLCSDRRCDVIEPGTLSKFSTEYENSRSVSLHSFLRGGSGDTAWQKAQLFREPTDQDTKSSFMIRMELKKRT